MCLYPKGIYFNAKYYYLQDTKLCPQVSLNIVIYSKFGFRKKMPKLRITLCASRG